MLLRDLTKVYISEYEEIENHGEPDKVWKFKGKGLTEEDVNKMPVKKLNSLKGYKLAKENNFGVAYLNIQQDINELDRKSTGEVDYSRYKARTTRDYNIQKGDGISFEDISELEEFIPEYYVKDALKIGSTTLYILEKIQK